MSAKGTMIPGIGDRLREMLGGNDSTSKDLASIAALPLFTAGAASLASSMTESMASIGRESLGTFSPAQTPGMAEIALSRGAGASRAVG